MICRTQRSALRPSGTGLSAQRTATSAALRDAPEQGGNY